jgi:surface polysaccharide O-acyltransferase-like enzyme
MAKSRLLFIDNLRSLMIAKVILVHLAITYGGTGGWYYYERPTTELSFIVLTFHNAVNQSFFMGLLFLLSAYLAVGSYDRKGPGPFLRDRFLRLGIPLLIFEFIIHPLQIYPLIRAGAIEIEGSFGARLVRYYSSFHIGSGPLWFVETLLIFVLVYTGVRLIGARRSHVDAEPTSPPSSKMILVFALLLGVLTFLARLWWPFGWSFGPLNLQFCFFVQYIAMLIVGVVAYRNDWLRRLPKATGRLWLGVGIFLIVVVFPVMFVLGGALQGEVAPFLGGWHWQALAYAMWDQLTGVAMMVGLIVFFRERFNRQGRLAKEASAGSYAAYIIHTPVLILFTLAVRDIAIYPLLKFVVVALILVPLCFTLGAVLRRLPLARRIL